MEPVRHPSKRRAVGGALLLTLGLAFLTMAGAASTGGLGSQMDTKRCPGGGVRAVVAGTQTCLKAGQRCKRSLDRQYHRYGFHCHTGRLRKQPPPPAPRFVTVTTTGAPEVVFDWTTDRCEDLDIPDLPSRVFRDADDQVQLISAHYVNRRFVGSDLNHLRRACDIVMASSMNPDPAAFDDHEWIASTWTPDGKTIYALVHNEYQG